MGDNLKQKAASGMMWSTIQKFGSMGLSFISGIILARLLTPVDYGCIGMLSIFMVVANSFVDSGFASALIQKRQPTHEDYSTIFWWNLSVSLLMYAILFSCAPIIARFYKMPLLSSVLRVQGLVLIINAFSIIQNNQLRKQFRFKKLTIVTMVASIVATTVTIYMAYMGFGVWALVAMNMLSAAIPAAIYWLTNKWYPLLVFSKKSFIELFNFGVFMFLSSLVNTFCNNIQGLLIGRFYNPATMGYYSKAKSTEELASTSISDIMGQVTYPVFAEYQTDKKMLVYVIKRMSMMIAYITFPMMFLLMLLAKPIFMLLYSERWLGSVPYFQILCFAGVAICLQVLNYNAVAAIGRSKIMFRWTIIKRISGIAFIVAGLYLWGLEGLLGGMVVSSWFIYFINAYLCDKHVGYKMIDQIKDLIPAFILSFFSIAASYAISYVLPLLSIYVLAIIQFVFFVFLYLGSSMLFRMEGYKYLVENLPVIFGRIKAISKK